MSPSGSRRARSSSLFKVERSIDLDVLRIVGERRVDELDADVIASGDGDTQARGLAYNISIRQLDHAQGPGLITPRMNTSDRDRH